MPSGLVLLVQYGARDVYYHENNNRMNNKLQIIKEKSIYEKQLEYISSIKLNDDIKDDDIIDDDIIDDDIHIHSFDLRPAYYGPSGNTNISRIDV